MELLVRKIQILPNRNTEHPLFYCHSSDKDHAPSLLLEKVGALVIIRARHMYYKIKLNPQTKNRVDIYMSILQANVLGIELEKIAQTNSPQQMINSKATPSTNAKGNMKLPNILWQKWGRYVRVAVRVETGTYFPQRMGGNFYIDLESPDDSHIKMTETEIHIGIDLNEPQGIHSLQNAELVEVPIEELQKGRNEKSPLHKTYGDIYLEISADLAGGIGSLLRNVEAPPVRIPNSE
ncbi:MAG: hypothetical protein Q7U78_00910 [Gallionella sp.]|nr:hypothetical protein [Gallionella sp.]